MNSNVLLKQLIISSFLILQSCGDNVETGEGLPPKPTDARSKKCSSYLVSNGPCFYNLPDKFPEGESLFMNFKDIEHQDTKGVTVGRGKWLCKNGKWKELQSPLCLTCEVGRSFEYCWNKLKESIP